MFTLAVDYDDTLFFGGIHSEGEPNREIIEKVKEFMDNEHCEIVLWTCREGELLKGAVERCKDEGITFDAINKNSPSNLKYMEESGDVFGQSKIVADFYVDDKAGNLDIFLGINVTKTCDSFADR